MVASHLKAVPDTSNPSEVEAAVHDLPRSVETGAERVRRLQVEAQALAHDQVAVFAHDLAEMALRSAEIAGGGEAYPVGVRELAARLASDLPQKVNAMIAIMDRLPARH